MNLTKLNLSFIILFGGLLAFNSCSSDEETPEPKPTITSVTPASATIGSTVTVTGTNFSATVAENTVKFNDVPSVISNASPTSLTVTVPELATSGKVTVTVNEQTAQSPNDFTVLIPKINSFSPLSGQAGDEVIIVGENFSTNIPDNEVKLNGTVAEVTAATETSLKIVVPEGAASGMIALTINGQVTTSEEKFTVLHSPEIISFSPENGNAGEELTIIGNNFSEVVSENQVVFNGVVATINSSTTTQLKVTVPEGTTSGKISVIVNGLATQTVTDFNFYPVIAGFSPTSGVSGDEMTITGKYFSTIVNENLVTVGGLSATVHAASSTELKLDLPGNLVDGPVSVTVNGLTAESTTSFTALYSPVITDINPLSGYTGDEIVITGEHFSTSASENIVRFNAVDAVVISSTESEIIAIVPDGATTGKVDVRVGIYGVQFASDFVVLAPPVISGFSPLGAFVGDQVTITGENFSTTLTDNIVEFNGTEAIVLSASNTQITVEVPSGATSGKIRLGINGSSVESQQLFEVITVYNRVALGDLHSSIIKGDNSLWVFGVNSKGQLGLGTNNNFNPNPQQLYSDIKMTSMGTHHTIILKNDNSVWTSGHNGWGQLGDGTNDDSNVAVQVMTNARAVISGSYHNLVVKNDNTLWGWGYNHFGQLGDGTTNDSNVPIQIMTNVMAASAGEKHSVILKNDNTLWAVGQNVFGQLGDGTFDDTLTPKQIMTGVKSIVAGDNHTLILKLDNTLWSFGNNDDGQLGDGSTSHSNTPIQIMSNVSSIATGDYHSLAIKSDNTLWGWGYNQFGQLGDGTNSQVNTPKQIMENVQSVDGGRLHSIIIKTDNTIWVTGNNLYGQLGDGKATNVNTPKRITF